MYRSTPSSSLSDGSGRSKARSRFGLSKSHTTAGRPSTSGDSSTSTLQSRAVTPPFSRKASLSHGSKFLQDHIRATTTHVSPEKGGPSTHPVDDRQQSTVGRDYLESSLPSRSGDDVNFGPGTVEAAQSTHSRSDSHTSTTAYSNMLARPGTAYSSLGATGGGPAFPPAQPPSPTLENITFQHIQETSSKRISTLDYLRKAHEGRVYWFNTLLFNKPDLQRMPYFESRKVARRATNYLLLGLSLPTVLDLNSSNPTEFLRTLNALLVEFESYQSIHPPDGASSLSRARFPQMFKRATAGGGKARRTSSAADIGLPIGSESSDSKATNGGGSGAGANSSTVFTMGETDLLPGEEYTHLLTPSLPFDPDFYETFATLCDVLIDCYTRLMSLVSGPRECNPYLAELFTKADARVRKIIVQGIVKEFEDSSRTGVKGEVAGVGRVVLGGLM